MVFYLIATNNENLSNQRGNEALIAFEALLSISLIVIISYKVKALKWRKSVFRARRVDVDGGTLFEAHLCLGTQMISADRKQSKDKVIYMSKYLKKQFPQTGVNFIDAMNDSFKKPVDLEILSKWLNQALNQKQRIQTVYFLAGLSIADGFMDQREIDLLKKISLLLQSTPKEFESIKAMYKQREERSHYQSSSSRPKSVSAKKSILNIAYKVLGVSEHADKIEIKKAYRSLVKKHHPDRFAKDSIEQQNIAEERFLEVQKSYEMIEKYK